MNNKRISELTHRWASLTCPIRPAAEDVAWYRAHLPDGSGRSALLLGSTPELRDILAELNYDAVIIDLNRENYNIMTQFCQHPERKETFLNSGWLECRSELDRAFDVVLGDGVFLFLSFPEGAQKLLLTMSSYLSTDGVMLFRQVFKGSEEPLETSLNALLAAEYPSQQLVSEVLMALIVQSASPSGVIDFELSRKLSTLIMQKLQGTLLDAVAAHLIEFQPRTALSIYDKIPPPISVPVFDEFQLLIPNSLELAAVNNANYCPNLNYKLLAIRTKHGDL